MRPLALSAILAAAAAVSSPVANVVSNAVGTLSAGTSLSVGPFTTSGNNRLILLFVGYASTWGGGVSQLNAPTRDGQTFTKIADSGSFAGDHYTECWALAAPNTGSASISISSSATLNGAAAWAVVLENAAQSGWTASTATLARDVGGAPSDLVSASVTLAGAGAAVAFAWGSNQGPGAATWGTPAWTAGTQALAVQTPASFARASGATLTGSGSKTFTWDTNFSGAYGTARLIVVDVEPA